MQNTGMGIAALELYYEETFFELEKGAST